MNTTTNKFELTFPDGEFKIKSLIEMSGRSQPFVHAEVKKALSAGKIKEIRRERLTGKGRPSAVYCKI